MSNDNSGKRKLGLVLNSNGPTKLKRISLGAFDDSNQTVPSSNKTTVSPSFSSSLLTATAKTDSLSVNTSYPARIVSIPEEQKQIIAKTAQWICMNPDKASLLIEKSVTNTSLSFLSHHHSPEGLYYAREMVRLRTEKEVQSICSGADEGMPMAQQRQHPQHASRPGPVSQVSALPPPLPRPSATSQATSEVSATIEKKERRNRWGPPPVEVASAATAVAAPPNAFDDIGDSTDGGESSHQRIGRLIQEQRELQLLESRIREAAKQSTGGRSEEMSIIALNTNTKSSLALPEREAQLHAERLKHYGELAALYEQDTTFRDSVEDAEANNGVIDGGTYEHRRRAAEMLKTADGNLKLTHAAVTGHHMSNYIPKDVLNSFLQQAQALKTGSNAAVVIEDTRDKIGVENVGFSMLKKSGWTEGTGLGSGGNGIVNPISVHSVVSSSKSSGNVSNAAHRGVPTGTVTAGAGIGVQATHQLSTGDDEFEQYRKRMMLSYKFRPNPMNNPRRDYY